MATIWSRKESEDIGVFRHQLHSYGEHAIQLLFKYYEHDLTDILETLDTGTLLRELISRDVLKTKDYQQMKGEGEADTFPDHLLQHVSESGRKAMIGFWESLFVLQESHPNILAVVDEITNRGENLVIEILLDEHGHALSPELTDVQTKHKQHLLEETKTLVEPRPPGSQGFPINEGYVNLTVVSIDTFWMFNQHELIESGIKHEEFLKDKKNNHLEHISRNRLFRWSHQSQCVPNAVMVSGVPGIGKTTLMQKFVYDWVNGKLYQRFAFVFFFKFRELNKVGAVSLEGMILQQYPHLGGQIGNILQDPERLLFIFDGLDESFHQIDFRSSTMYTDLNQGGNVGVIVDSLVRQKLLKGCSVLITSRPTRMASLNIDVFQRRAEIMGFLYRDRLIYFERVFGNKELSEKAFHYVQENDALYAFCYIPSYCWIICTVLSMCFRAQPTITDQLKESLPKTVTQLYVTFVSSILANHRVRKDDIPTSRDLLTSIGRMAEHGVRNHITMFDESHLHSFGVRTDNDLFSGFMMDNELFSCFMMESGRPPSVIYTFLHVTLQEFFAALVHFITYSPEKLQKLLDRAELYREGRAEIFLRFLCGLSDSSTRSMLESHVGKLSAQASRHVLSWLQKKTEKQIPDKVITGTRELLDVFYYLHESRNRDLVLQCVGSNRNIDFSNIILTSVDCSVLSFILESCRETGTLTLMGCNIQNEALGKLVPALHTVRNLSLRFNHLTDSSCPYLASGIRKNETLRRLDLSENNLEGPHFSDLMTAVSTSRIEKLLLQRVKLTDEYTPFLVSLSNSTNLTLLDLIDNELTDDSAGYIQDLLVSSTSLKEIRMDGSYFSFEVGSFLHKIKPNVCSMDYVYSHFKSGNPVEEEELVESADPEEESDDLVTPIINGKTYSLELQPGGLFCCSEMGIMFRVKSQVTITYELESESDYVEQIQKNGYDVVGPMFNITVQPDAAGVVSEVHLPHYLYLEGLGSDISFIKCGNFNGGKIKIIRPVKIGPSHVVLENPSFSIITILISRLRRKKCPFKGKVLVYGRVVCPEDVNSMQYKFHLYLMPKNQPQVKKLTELKEKSRFQEMGKPPIVNKKLHIGKKYAVIVQPDANISPKDLQFEISHKIEDIPYFEVNVDSVTEQISLRMLLEKNEEDPLWTCDVTKGDLGEMRFRAGASVHTTGSSPSAEHFVDIHETELIQGVPDVKEVVDELKGLNLLTNEQRDTVSCKEISQDQMRELLKYVRGWGDDDKDKLLNVLEKTNKPLVRKLRKQ